MNEINFAAVIAGKRHAAGMTQEELAAHVGVTKASVSKWETGNSLPDIALLPVLAALFDATVDELISYAPQLTYEENNKLYNRLAQDFSQKSFDEVLAECRALVKKYYSCHYLLLNMAKLYLNHASLAPTPECARELLDEAIQLCQRTTAHTKDIELSLGAMQIQAHCHLVQQDGQAVLDLLGESPADTRHDRSLIAAAQQLLGRPERAKETLQVQTYVQLLEFFHGLMVMLQYNLHDLTVGEPTFQRAEILADTFNMRKLNANNSVMMYLLAAQMYQQNNEPDAALVCLEKYADVAMKDFFPLRVGSDDYFNALGEFMEKNIAPIPRSDAAVKKDVLAHVLPPNFPALQDLPAYKNLVHKLQTFLGGNEHV